MQSSETAIVKPEPPKDITERVETKVISQFSQASEFTLTPQEIASLHRDIPSEKVLIRPDGMIYLEWAWYAEVLDETFGVGQWALTPAPWNPKLFQQGAITYREYVLWIRGKFIANAVGHHEETRKTANFGDAAEATYANALVRCCKRLGVARGLWTKSEIDKIKQNMKKPIMPEVDELKNSLCNAADLESLKIAWDAIAKRKTMLSPATFETLFDMKENRKKALMEA